MEIQKFDMTSIKDQADYMTVLVDGAQKVLIDAGKDDLADKVYKLFTEIPAVDEMPLGMTELTSNLDRARLANVRNCATDHNALRIEVEDAMAVTLKENGIELPDSFFTGASDFRPKFP